MWPSWPETEFAPVISKFIYNFPFWNLVVCILRYSCSNRQWSWYLITFHWNPDVTFSLETCLNIPFQWYIQCSYDSRFVEELVLNFQHPVCMMTRSSINSIDIVYRSHRFSLCHRVHFYFIFIYEYPDTYDKKNEKIIMKPKEKKSSRAIIENENWWA